MASKPRIRIKLKAYDHYALDRSTREIVMTAKRTGAIIAGPIPLPTKKSIFTVQRSTNNDKKSREQFELCVHKRLLEITYAPAALVEALERLDLPAGVEVEIKA